MIKTVSFSRTPEKFQEYAKRGIQKQINAGNMTEDDAPYIENK